MPLDLEKLNAMIPYGQQSRAAAEIGISRVQLCNLLKGKSQPSLRTIELIARHQKVPVSALLLPQ